MPALDSVVFTRTSTDGRSPIAISDGLWYLRFPASAENCPANTCTSVDFHHDITLPIGYIGIVAPINGDDVIGKPDIYVNSRAFLGTNAAIPVKLQVINVSANPQTPDVNTNAAILMILKQDDYKPDDSAGTW